ncbi:MAG: TlpA disulfide reductase family protein, partial [Proteobacteria bacterium]|nr:TlpA disulfide reductase family protein [Pseudomonadota bacterium]
MASKSKANLIGLSVFAVIIGAIAFLPRFEPAGPEALGGPPVTGAMRYFDLAKVRLPRPEISWTTGTGETVSLSDFQGKVVLLNYWASWCAPCLRELPSLDRLAARYNSDKFRVIALNVDPEGKALASKTAKSLNLSALELNLDPELIAYRAIGIRAMPSTFLFDQNGVVIGVLRGAAEWDSRD